MKLSFILAGLLTLLPLGQAGALWQGKLDLEPYVLATVFREANDGQWLAGEAHPHLWHLDHNGNPILHVGVFQAFNAERGNMSFGPMAGLDLSGISRDLGLNVPDVIATVGERMHLPTVFKAAAIFSSLVTIDAFAGYRPVHDESVRGELVYGGAACLAIPFGVTELRGGL